MPNGLRNDFIPPLSVTHICMPATKRPLLPIICTIRKNNRKATSISKQSASIISKEGSLLSMFVYNKTIFILYRCPNVRYCGHLCCIIIVSIFWIFLMGLQFYLYFLQVCNRFRFSTYQLFYHLLRA